MIIISKYTIISKIYYYLCNIVRGAKHLCLAEITPYEPADIIVGRETEILLYCNMSFINVYIAVFPYRMRLLF